MDEEGEQARWIEAWEDVKGRSIDHKLLKEARQEEVEFMKRKRIQRVRDA